MTATIFQIVLLRTPLIKAVILTENLKIFLIHLAPTARPSKIKLLPSIPYEHDRVRRVERLHCTLTDMANKQLAFKDHLSPKYWEFSYRHAADLHNIRPKKSLNGKSPYSIYYGSPYNLSKFSTFWFGSVVMGHLPLNLQTATSGRSDERYFVGITHDFNSGTRLYCLINKTTITRHSCKFFYTNTPNAPFYVISDPIVAFNISLPDNSPEEAGPTLSPGVGPTLS